METVISENEIGEAHGYIAENRDVLLGLLDFYSDRATAHASLSIAVIFGIFGLLAIYKCNFKLDMPSLVYSILFFLAYAILWFGALYLALNFGWYAQVADRAKFLLSGQEDLVKAFAAYRKPQGQCPKAFDSFLNASTQDEWLYETSQDVIYDDMDIKKNSSLKNKIEEERKFKKYKFLHRRYVGIQWFLKGLIGFKSLFLGKYPASLKMEYLSPAMRKELLRVCGREGDVPEKGNYKKSFIIYVSFAVTAILILAIKLISDWIGTMAC